MLPVPPHFTHETEALWPLRTRSACLLIASHIRTVPSLDEDATRGLPGCWRWYGSQARLRMNAVCPFMAFPNGFPVLESQSRTVLSLLPVAIMVSSGEYATQSTQLVWPCKVCIGVPVSQSHILAVLSPDPVHNLDDDEEEK